MKPKQEKQGCGCSSIPISLILVLIGVGYWGVRNLDKLNLAAILPESVSQLLPQAQPSVAPTGTPLPKPTQPSPVAIAPQRTSPQLIPPQPAPVTSPASPSPSVTAPPTAWEKKSIRGIYLSRYQVTNNASEKTIRDRVRYYKQEGFNTIIHGVWGNGCTMYPSQVMQQTFGERSCPNQFQDQWLDWLIDEAHKQGMQVHAYFEKGIKLDKNSPIFDRAIAKRWIVPGVDKTYPGIDHYLLDVEVPEVANFFHKISAEFVKRYPKIDAVQWDDYLGYHAELPGKVDRTVHLTTFVLKMRAIVKQANPNVSFDLCHHNPYWGKRYFAADWQNWQIDRAFIQIYNDANFNQELTYAEQYAGVALSEKQLHRLGALIQNPKIKGILVFPFSGQPEQAARLVKQTVATRKVN